MSFNGRLPGRIFPILLRCRSLQLALNGGSLRSKWSVIESAADEKCSRRVPLSMTPHPDIAAEAEGTGNPPSAAPFMLQTDRTMTKMAWTGPGWAAVGVTRRFLHG